jgi:hypothetical protein
MATTNQNPIYSFIEETKPKPRTDEKERIKQNLRINAIGQVINLVAQGIGGSKGATIIPMKDQYSPYAMNEFAKMRQEELVGDNKTREFQFRSLLDEKKKDDDDAKMRKQQEFTAGQNELNREAKAKASALYSMPVTERLRIEQEDSDFRKKKADQDFQQWKTTHETRVTEKTEQKEADFYAQDDQGNRVPLMNADVPFIWGKIITDPDLQVKGKKLGLTWVNAFIDGNVKAQQTVISTLYPDIMNGTIESGAPEAKTTTNKPVAEKKSEGGFTPEQQAKADKIQRVLDNKDPREKKVPLLKAMLKKDWGYSDKEADEYIEKNLPK